MARMLRTRRCARFTTAVASVLAGLLAAAPLAHGQAMPQPFAPWSGQNPFNCELQDVGFGTDFPDPDADPFCVKFDKTSQNVTDLGIVEFLSKEPERVAAAIEKCFYFQRDEWTGSIFQGEEPELWHWNGSYFFDRAKGIGGASARNFRLGGTPFDATPYVPEPYLPYFDADGGGGAITQLEVPIDPACAAMVDTPAEREQVYGKSGVIANCVSPGGRVSGRAIGAAKLGIRREGLRKRLGEPERTSPRADRWCVIGGSNLRAVYLDGTAALLRTTNPGQSVHGVARGDGRRRAERRLDVVRELRINAHTVLIARDDRRTVFVGVYGGRVRWIGIAKANLGPRRLGHLLRLATTVK